MAEFCCITYPDRTGYNTMADSLFDAAVKALHWVEVERQSFGTARHFHDDETLLIRVGMVPEPPLHRANRTGAGMGTAAQDGGSASRREGAAFHYRPLTSRSNGITSA